MRDLGFANTFKFIVTKDNYDLRAEFSQKSYDILKRKEVVWFNNALLF